MIFFLMFVIVCFSLESFLLAFLYLDCKCSFDIETFHEQEEIVRAFPECLKKVSKSRQFSEKFKAPTKSY